jgi:hypothetical protein
MTPQGNFTVLAEIDPARADELSELLASMNHGPGRLDLNNPLIPFTEFDTLHYGRLLILKDNCLMDTRAYSGGPVPIYPLYLAFLGDIDGDVDTFFEEVARRAGPGLRTIFSCCIGFNDTTNLVTWLKARSVPAIAVYVNWRGAHRAPNPRRSGLGGSVPEISSGKFRNARPSAGARNSRALARVRRKRKSGRPASALDGKADAARVVDRQCSAPRRFPNARFWPERFSR